MLRMESQKRCVCVQKFSRFTQAYRASSATWTTVLWLEGEHAVHESGADLTFTASYAVRNK